MKALLPLLVLGSLAAFGEAPPRTRNDLSSYLMVAAAYGSSDRDAALTEIRKWKPWEIRAALNSLRGQGKKLRSAPKAADEIAFGAVEAAVLMHAEAGLLALQSLSLPDAKLHLDSSLRLYQWSTARAADARNRAIVIRHHAFKEGEGAKGKKSAVPPGTEIVERIDARDYYLALASATLGIGFPSTAQYYAESALQLAPLDADVQLVFGCMAEGLADLQHLRQAEGAAADWRERAESALRRALALDDGLLEARLHLGRVLVDGGRLAEAQPFLESVEESAVDDRQRYLARLLRGRSHERRQEYDEAAGSYRRALEAWPDSQAARLALGLVVERSSGPSAARPLVAASLAASQRPDRAADPWWLYPFGPPGVEKAVRARLWAKVVER